MGLFKNIVTFGAAGRIEKKMDSFQELKNQYESLYKEMEQKRNQVNNVLEDVIQAKVNGLESLKKINKISKTLKGKDRQFMYRSVGNQIEEVDFSRVNQTIEVGQIALNATKGVTAGVSTALGAWALVSTFGSASTGAALAGLSGAAATNATLAWFGGGALAAGGGGIAAGTAVLGGIIAVPALVIMGVFSHVNANKKINEIEREMNKILNSMDQIQANLLQLRLIEDRAKELIVSINKARDVFEIELKRTIDELNKKGIWTKFIRWIKNKIFRKNYYSEEDVKLIAYIGGIATDFAVMLDTPVLEE